ncbi:MAG: ATP-binding protein [Planctomycetota bacterium]
MTTPAVAREPASPERLRAMFDAFNRVAKDLEEAYHDLKEKASQVNVALRDANQELVEKVAEYAKLSSYLNCVLKSMPSGAIVVDEQTRIVLVNPAAERILETRAEALLGGDARLVSDASGAPILRLSDAATLKSTAEIERKVRLPSGKTIVISSRVSPLKDEHGQPCGSIEMISDLTEVASLRDSLHKIDTLAALGEMAAAIAHEIKSPVNAMKSFAQLTGAKLKRGEPQPAIEHVAQIERCADEVSLIVTNLLSFASPNGQLRGTIALAPVLRAAIPPDAGAQSVAVHVPPALAQVRVRGDTILLRQAVRNLILNALQCGGAPVAVTLCREAQHLVVRVSDRGPGVPEQLRARMFLPFVTGRGAHGTGLGLAIVHRIVDLHGGRVELESSNPGGSTFAIRLREVVAQEGPAA